MITCPKCGEVYDGCWCPVCGQLYYHTTRKPDWEKAYNFTVNVKINEDNSTSFTGELGLLDSPNDELLDNLR